MSEAESGSGSENFSEIILLKIEKIIPESFKDLIIINTSYFFSFLPSFSFPITNLHSFYTFSISLQKKSDNILTDLLQCTCLVWWISSLRASPAQVFRIPYLVLNI